MVADDTASNLSIAEMSVMEKVVNCLCKCIGHLSSEPFTADIPDSEASLQAPCGGLKTLPSKVSNDLVVAKSLLYYHLFNMAFECIKIKVATLFHFQ